MPDKKCEELVKAEKYPELLNYCNERLQIQSDDETYLFYQAVAYTGLKNFPSATNVFTKLFNRTKKYFYLLCRGLVRFLAMEFREGRKDLHTAIENDDRYGNMIFAYRIASTYYDVEDARDALKKALVLNPKASMEELEKFFEKIAEDASVQDRLLIVRVMELLKSL
ncbi:MAG TPA: hypothetical protein VJH24_00760 [Candidatus Bilamarchaeaceae archaeon]|nr:hypothetical protein [Candidatus Bilamarchaeaceae archaeon]